MAKARTATAAGVIPTDPAPEVPPLGELIDDPLACRRMGEFGRERVTGELEWRHEAPRLLAAYDVLFAGERAVDR